MICLEVNQDFNISVHFSNFAVDDCENTKLTCRSFLAVTTQQQLLPRSCVTSGHPCKTSIGLIVRATRLIQVADKI